MANITRIKASDPRTPKESEPKAKNKKAKAKEKVAKAPAKPTKTEKKVETKKSVKEEKSKKKMPVVLAIITWPFRMVANPFIALGRYIKSSWQELRQVRWPSGKATWKMAFAVLVYAGLLIAIIMLLDMLFTWLFNLILV